MPLRAMENGAKKQDKGQRKRPARDESASRVPHTSNDNDNSANGSIEDKKIDYLNKPEIFNKYYKDHSAYLSIMCDVRLAEMNLANDYQEGARVNYGGSILKQLRKEGEKAYTKWQRRSAAIEKRNNGKWKVDYIISCERRVIGQSISQTTYQLVKYDNFPVPTFTSPLEEGIALTIFERRMAEGDLIELHLRESMPARQFEVFYPERYLEYEDGIGNDGFVQSIAALYRNELMAIEDEWNSVFGPHDFELIIEDWTGKHTGIKDLRDFKFIKELLFSHNVQQFLDTQQQVDDKFCRGCMSCKIMTERPGQFCCELRSEKTKSGGTVSFACTEKCEGNNGKLSELHRGRGVRVCVFRDHEKGWSVRTLREIYKSQYFTQIIGEVNERPSENGVHDFEMSMNPPNRTEPLTIATAKMGNEGRFINHSCLANVGSYSVMLERYGHWFTRKCLYAERDILAGEEITADYFIGYSVKSKLENKMFQQCLCGTDICYEWLR